MKTRRRWLVLMALAAMASACYSRPMLLERAEAKRLLSDLRSALAQAVELTDRSSVPQASGFEQAARSVSAVSAELRPVLEALDYSDALVILEAFNARFREYRALDAAIAAEARTAIRDDDDAEVLAEALGKRRMAAAECIDQLKALDESLAKHEVTATR